MEETLWMGICLVALIGMAAYCVRSGWNEADFEAKKRETTMEICARKAETAGQLEKCLREKE